MNYKNIRPYFLPTLSLVAGFMLSGCAGGVSTHDVAGFDSQLKGGNYPGAAASAVAAGKIAPDGKSDNLLWSLNAGAAMVYAGDPAHAIPVLDNAKDMIDQRTKGAIKDKGQYSAKTYDGVMLDAYQSIAAMQSGNGVVARAGWLRSDDRQRRAEEDFGAEIAAAQSRGAPTTDFDPAAAMKSVAADPKYLDAAKDMGNYGAYKPFINPAAIYLSGLYFLNTADSNRSEASDDFKKVHDILGSSPLLDRDMALAKQTGKITPKTWVVFENGQGSALVQYNVIIPVPILGKNPKVSTATIALPRLHENAAAAQYLVVGAAGEKTTVVGNFDNVERSEFQRRYPSIMRAAVLEAVAKIVLQNVAAQEKSGLALLAATVVSNVSVADVRSWSALPKDIQAARIETPANGIVPLHTDTGADLGSAKVPTDVSCIVYVKQMQAGTPASIEVLRF